MLTSGRITFNTKIMGGQACVREMRIPVSVIVSLVANKMSDSQIMSEYPDIEPDDIVACLEYAAWLTTEEIHEYAL